MPACLDSLGKLNYSNYEVVVVDACSTDESKKLIREQFPGVKLVALDKKVGIGEAINCGVNVANGEILVIDFNTDETAEPNWLGRLVEVIQNQDNHKVIVGGARLQHGSERLVDDLGMKHLYPFGVSIKRYNGFPIEKCPKEDIQEVDYLNMLAMPNLAYQELGPFDQDYYFFGEDAEYCFRARSNRYKVLLVPTAITWHRTSATIGKSTAFPFYCLRRSMLNLVLKYYPWYLLPCGLVGYSIIFLLDLILLLPFGYRIFPQKGFSMFSRRRRFGEVIADAKAIWWNMVRFPKIVRFRLSPVKH